MRTGCCAWFGLLCRCYIVFYDCDPSLLTQMHADGSRLCLLGSGETWGWDGVLGAVYPEPQLDGPICMGSILGDATTTYASFPNTTGAARSGRENGVIRVSADNAKTWHDHTVFGASVPFAYSCLTELEDAASLGVLWETGMPGCSGPSCRSVFSVIKR